MKQSALVVERDRVPRDVIENHNILALSGWDIPKHVILTQYQWNGPMRARFDENTGVGLNTRVKECPLSIKEHLITVENY